MTAAIRSITHELQHLEARATEVNEEQKLPLRDMDRLIRTLDGKRRFLHGRVFFVGDLTATPQHGFNLERGHVRRGTCDEVRDTRSRATRHVRRAPPILYLRGDYLLI